MEFITTVLARVLVGVPFFMLGSMHFVYAEKMLGALPEWLPGGVFWIYLTGFCLVLGGMSLFINKHTILACRLLALLLVVFAVFIHIPNIMKPELQQIAMIGLIKDLGLLGGVLTWAGAAQTKKNY